MELEKVPSSSIFADANVLKSSSPTVADIVPVSGGNVTSSRVAEDVPVNEGLVLSSSTDADPVPVNKDSGSSSKIDADDDDPKSTSRDEVDVVSSPSSNVATSSDLVTSWKDDSCTNKFIKSAPYSLGCAVIVGTIVGVCSCCIEDDRSAVGIATGGDFVVGIATGGGFAVGTAAGARLFKNISSSANMVSVPVLLPLPFPRITFPPDMYEDGYIVVVGWKVTVGKNVADSMIVPVNDGRRLLRSGWVVGASTIETLPPLLGEVGIVLGVYDGVMLDIVLGTSESMWEGAIDGMVDGTELKDGATLGRPFVPSSS